MEHKDNVFLRINYLTANLSQLNKPANLEMKESALGQEMDVIFIKIVNKYQQHSAVHLPLMKLVPQMDNIAE